MRSGGRRHLPATESAPDSTAQFVGVCANVRGSSGWALATGNVPSDRRNLRRPRQQDLCPTPDPERKCRSVDHPTAISPRAHPWPDSWAVLWFSSHLGALGMTLKQGNRGGSAFVKASPRMCTAVGAYELAGVPYCIACTPGGSQDTCRSPGVLGGSARCRRGDHMACPVHAGAASRCAAATRVCDTALPL